MHWIHQHLHPTAPGLNPEHNILCSIYNFHFAHLWFESFMIRAVIVAQLVEQLLLIPEIRGSNSVIGNFIYYQLYYKNCLEKIKIKNIHEQDCAYFSSFNTVDSEYVHYKKIADDWIRTADLWYRERPHSQLCHNYCSQKHWENESGRIELSSGKEVEDAYIILVW